MTMPVMFTKEFAPETGGCPVHTLDTGSMKIEGLGYVKYSHLKFYSDGKEFYRGLVYFTDGNYCCPVESITLEDLIVQATDALDYIPE